MPYLLDSICTIICVFYKYAQLHGGSFSLKRREMKQLIQKEFAEVIRNPHDPRTVELTFQMLDTNGDGLIDFREYLLLIFKVAKACYSHLKPRQVVLKKEETSTALCGGEPQRCGEHGRKPQSPDPEGEPRRTQTCAIECRERPRSRAPQSRETERRRDQQDEPDVREADRRRSHFHDQDAWARSYTSWPTRGGEVEDQQASYASEHTHTEEKRIHPSEPEPMDSESRRLHSYESETRDGERRRPQQHEGDDFRRPQRRHPQHYETETADGDKRRPQEHHQADPQEKESERRRPEPRESGSIQDEYSKPLTYGREDNQGRGQYYEPESRERESARRRIHGFEPRRGKTEIIEAWEPVIREEIQRSQCYHSPEHSERDLEQRRSPACEPTRRNDSQGRQQYYEPTSWEWENKRTRRPQMHDSEPREGGRRRPPLANLRQDEKEKPQSTDLLTRTTDQARSNPSEYSPRRINQSREQTYEFGPREKKRTHQLNDLTYGGGEQRRQMYSIPEVVEKEHQMRPMSCISKCRTPEPSGLQRCYHETREREVKGHIYGKYAI